MTHGDAIDIGGSSLTSPESLEVSFSYKFSTMKFERFNFRDNEYAFLNNELKDPLQVLPRDANRAIITGNEIIPVLHGGLRTLNNGYSGKDILSSYITAARESSMSEVDPDSVVVLDNLKEDEKYNLYNSQYEKQVIDSNAKGSNIYGNGSVNNDSENQVDLESNGGNLLKSAGENLLQNVKKAALNEAQRQLNSQFRLVNNSLDKVRNTFGIGRMREPTNVYNSPPGGQFFFDVKNSLRDFAGDVLGGLLGG